MNPPDQENVKKWHQDALVFDGLLMWGNLDSRKNIQNMIQGNYAGANYTVANHSHDFTGALDNILKYRALLEENSDLLALAISTKDIEQAKKQKKVGVVLGFQDSRAVEKVEYLDVFHSLGVRIIQLTYNAQNLAGTGCCDLSQGKITYHGQNVIRKMEKLGIALDLSHCADETTESALAFAERPVLFTHVGVRKLCNAYGRCKTDKQLEMVAKKGGVAGICFGPFLIKRDPKTWQILPSTVADVADALDYMVKLIGVDHVGFGSDLVPIWQEMGRTPPDSSLRLWRTLRPDVFGRGPTEEYDPFPQGLQTFSELPNLTAELVKRGYGAEDVKKILGGNFLRVLKEIWGS